MWDALVEPITSRSHGSHTSGHVDHVDSALPVRIVAFVYIVIGVAVDADELFVPAPGQWHSQCV